MAVKGLDRLKRQLKALPRLQIEAAGQALAQNAAELANAMQQAAPADKGDLVASIGSGPVGSAPRTGATQAFRAQNTERAAVLSQEGLAYEVWAGSDIAFYARWVEFGTAGSVLGQRMGARNSDHNQSKSLGRIAYRTHSGSRAQPFFFPVIRAFRKRMTSRLARQCNKAAKQAAAIR